MNPNIPYFVVAQSAAFGLPTDLASALIGALIGGLLSLFGTFGATWYQNRIRRKNIQHALVAEIDLITETLELLVVANRMYLSSCELELAEFEYVDQQRLERCNATEHPFNLLSVAHYNIIDHQHNRIYSSNTDKIGLLKPLQIKRLVRFYSNVDRIYTDIEVITPTADQIVREGEDARGVDGGNPIIVTDFLTIAEKAYYSQSKVVEVLK